MACLVSEKKFDGGLKSHVGGVSTERLEREVREGSYSNVAHLLMWLTDVRHQGARVDSGIRLLLFRGGGLMNPTTSVCSQHVKLAVYGE